MRATATRPAVVLLVLLFALAGPPAGASAVGSAFEETLPNGLRVIYVQHRANPMVCSSVVVGAGVVHEPEGMNGASHFLEHLLFNGTERRTQRQLYDEVDRLGAYNNATTRDDHTLFTLLVQKEFAEQGLDVQADMLFHSTLPPEKFDKEKGIVLEELAKDENDPGYVAGAAFREFALAGTPLARPVLGSKASIGALTRDRVFAYYRSRYVPANMVLVVMGDFELPDMKGLVRRTFGAASRGKVPAAAKGAWPALPAKNLARRPLETGRAYVYAVAPLPLPPSSADLAAVELLVEALAGADDAPLSRAVPAGGESGVLSMSLGVAPRGAPWGTLEFEATIPAGGSAEPVLSALVRTLRSPAALAAAREGVEAVRAARRADEVLTADQIHYYALTRSAYLLGSAPGYLARRLDLLDEIGDEELDRAEGILRAATDSLRFSVVGPGSAGEEVAWRGPEPDAAPAPAERTTRRRSLGSGLEVQVERNGDSRVFAAHLLARPRAASEPEGKGGIADFLHRLLLRGTVVSDRNTIAARLRDLGARAKTHDDPSVPYDDYYTTPEFSFVRLEMPADRWREGLSLLGEIVRFPRFDPAEIEGVRREMLDLLRRRTESTRGRAQELVARTLAPGHPLSRPVLGTPESIASITADDLRAFHASYFTGTRLSLAVVSPVDPEAVFEAAGAAVGALPAGDAAPPVAAAPVTPAGTRAEETLGKEQASVSLGYLFDAEPGDEAALLVAGALLSDQLSFRLREEQGLAYSLSASIAPWGGRTRFDATMATRQANVEAALAGLADGTKAFAAADPDPAAVTRAANAVRGRMLMRRLTRINQAYFAALERMDGRAAGDDLERLARLRSVTAADVRRVARRYLDLSRCASIVIR